MLWLSISALSYAATFSGIDDRLDAAEVNTPPISVTVAPIRSIDPPVDSVLRRDPFGGATSLVLRRHGETPATESDHDREADADATVPDIAPPYADEIAFGETSKAQQPVISVRATITGKHPVAYIEVGDKLDIVRVADTVGSRRVAAIDLRGITFADGTRLDLSDEPTQAPPMPRRIQSDKRTDMLTREFQHLRELLLAREPARAESPTGVGRPTPEPVVTPGPLRTVDPNGLPVGTTPTPGADNPTAFPVPYPYPPRPR